MAQVSGTYLTHDSVGIREDLADVIYNISPEQTPLISAIGTGPQAKQTSHEWQIEELAAATTANAHLEGDETGFSTPSPTVRVQNVTQIMKKSVIVSGTNRAVNAAGRSDELIHQTIKRGKELRRDMESIFFANQAGDAGGGATPRALAGLGAWVKTNVSLAGDGGNPTYTSGLPGAARTDGTQRAFTETQTKEVLQSCYTEGAEPDIIMVGPYNKGVFSGFAGIASQTNDVSRRGVTSQAAVVGAADVYVSDFGNLVVKPSRFQRERDAWFLDTDYVTRVDLRSLFMEELAKTGDADKRHLIIETTLRVNNEAAIGLVADLEVS